MSTTFATENNPKVPVVWGWSKGPSRSQFQFQKLKIKVRTLNFDGGVDFLCAQFGGGDTRVDSRLPNVGQQQNILPNWNGIVWSQILYSFPPPETNFTVNGSQRFEKLHSQLYVCMFLGGGSGTVPAHF